MAQGAADAWAEEMGITYGELKCSSAASRWGSCSRDGVIRISVYLLLAPERAIDYVLIHELAPVSYTHLTLPTKA